MSQRCPFCHQEIPALQFQAHLAHHTQLRKDGQMTEHVTVAPEGRYPVELLNVPRWYRHESCGEITGMPAEI